MCPRAPESGALVRRRGVALLDDRRRFGPFMLILSLACSNRHYCAKLASASARVP